MSVCIPKEIAQSLKSAVESGEVSLMKLSKMTTEERSAVFKKYLKNDELVKKLNTGFEARMNSETSGILRKYVLREVDKVPAKSKKDILNRLNKIKNVLNPAEGKPFLADLAEQKIGVRLSQDEATTLFKYADDAKKVKDEISVIESAGTITDTVRYENLLDQYTLKQLALSKYSESLLARNFETVAEMAKGVSHAEGAERVSKFSKLAFHTSTNVVGSILKGSLASVDNGVWGMQGINTLLGSKNGKLWAKNLAQSWKDLISPETWKGAAGVDAENLKKWINIDRGSPLMDRELMKLYRSKNYRNGVYDADPGFYGLDILGRGEEALPPSFLSSLPVYGRLHRVAEDLYNSSTFRLRNAIADELIQAAKDLEMDVMSREVAQELGEGASSYTGRGRFRGMAKGLEASSELLNLTLFSARLLKSTIDTYWLPIRGYTTGADNPAQRLVAKKVARVWRGIAAIGVGILGAQQILGEDVIKIDTHPTSSTFGMISINGGDYVTIFGNSLSISRVIARIFSDKIYDPKLGVFKERKFYEDNWDALVQFVTAKKSPWASFVKDLTTQEHFGGEPVTPLSMVENYLIPITWQGVKEEAFDKNDLSSALQFMLLSGHGFSTKDMKWNPTGKEWVDLKTADEKKYWEAVSELGAEMDAMIEEWRASSDYQEMTEDERTKYAEKALTKAKNSVINNYSDFIPEETED